MWSTVILVIISFVSLVYYVLTRKFSYWKNKKVPYLKPVPFFGNYKDLMLLKTFIGNATKKMYEQLPDQPYIGVFFGTEPTLLVQDPELLKLIMTKDFYYFHGREVSKYIDRESITQGIFFQHGDHWKVIRQNLTPLFSSAKMKNMFHLIEKCTHTFDALLEQESSFSDSIEANTLISRFTIDCVGTCAFGIEINIMQNYENNPFRDALKLIFGTTNSSIRGYKNIFRAIWPKLFYGFGLQSFPSEVSHLMTELATGVFKLRNYEPSTRNDFIDLILTFKKRDYLIGDSMSSMKTGESKKTSIKADDELMAGQCAVFFGGGAETSATTLTLTLFELAKNPEAQRRIQMEVDEYLKKRGGKLEYNCVTELPYMQACVDETLRLYPVFSIVTREVMEDYTFPDGLHLDKGVRIHIPVYHLHHDPRNFYEPERFRPERFLPEELHKIKPFTYLPFGEGPRNCIGMRFSRMQVHAGLVTVFKNYNVHLADGMSSTVDFDAGMLVAHTNCDVNLKFEPRKHCL